ncbi:hypothetical protein ACSQ67_023749 [Phaseolus vulgaris]
MISQFSFLYMVNMKNLYKVTIMLSSMMMFLFGTTHSIVVESNESYIKSATFLSEKFEVGPGKIVVKTLLDIDFPKGHIGVKSFDVEVVDEDGKSVPLYETYLHHWFAVKYIENITMSHYIKKSHDLRNGIEFERNDGMCQGFLLPHYLGLGGESRGTSSNLLDPFAVELGPTRNLSLRYKIRWVDWDEHQVPLRFYILDSTDHNILFQEIMTSVSPHVKKANIPMTKGGYLIYGTAHMHIGVVNSTLYGQDGRVLCTSNPKYGTGKEAGNENGYLVGMSVCYPKPGSIKIKDGEILTLESIYENKFRIWGYGAFLYLLGRSNTEQRFEYLM